MDLRKYYQEIQAIADAIEEKYPVVMSLATEDGGAAGRLTQVTKQDAAQLIHGKRARLATAEESQEFHSQYFRDEEKEMNDAAEQIALRMLREAGLHRVLQDAANTSSETKTTSKTAQLKK